MKRKTILAITIFFIVQFFVTGFCCKLSAKEKITLESNGVVIAAYDTCHTYQAWCESYAPLAPFANMATLGLLQGLWTNHIEFQGYKFKCFDGPGTYYITKVGRGYFCMKNSKVYSLQRVYFALYQKEVPYLSSYILSGTFGKFELIGKVGENGEFVPYHFSDQGKILIDGKNRAKIR